MTNSRDKSTNKSEEISQIGEAAAKEESVHIMRAYEQYPKAVPVLDGENLPIPYSECEYMMKCRYTINMGLVSFLVVPGESLTYIGCTTDGIIALTEYRIALSRGDNLKKSIPLGMIDSVQCRDLYDLYLHCKDANIIK